MKDVKQVEYNKLYAFNVNNEVVHGLVAKLKNNVATVWTNKAGQIDIDLNSCTRIVDISI